MSKLEHIVLAKHGPQAIAEWREGHPGERLDFSGASMSNYTLNTADLSEADLTEADLVGVLLNQANLQRANLRGAMPVMGQLRRADLRQADLTSANLTRADLGGANVAGSNLTRATLNGADLTGANLAGAHLVGSTLNEANLSGADLSGANLTGASFSHADLTGTNLAGANLTRATFHRTILDGTKFDGAIMLQTVFGDCDLGKAVQLDTVRHEGPSVVGADTIYRSAGRIQEKFLREAGVPEESVNLRRPAKKSSGQYYTCFISCAIKDLDFTRKLHSDLQARGVRCWYFPADTRGGLWVAEDVDRGISYYDKLLVVFSAESLGTERLREEVTHGIQKQQEGGQWIFYPVAISDAGVDPGNRYVRSLGLGNHVMFDFRGWEDPQQYASALDRLVGDLNSHKDISAGMVAAEGRTG